MVPIMTAKARIHCADRTSEGIGFEHKRVPVLAAYWPYDSPHIIANQAHHSAQDTQTLALTCAIRLIPSHNDQSFLGVTLSHKHDGGDLHAAVVSCLMTSTL